VSGLHPHPVRDPKGHSYGQTEKADHVPADAFRDDTDYLRGIDLYHAGYLWEAHEAWEGIWKASIHPVDRDLYQGLIQLAAALIKAHEGNTRGARRLAQAARARFTRVAAVHSRYRGLDLAALLSFDGRWNTAPRLV
jgi:predicted metal-dependent hydrolase